MIPDNGRNVEACKMFSEIARTSYGPNGLKKLVINKHGRLMVTSDAATIVRELEVIHPAAKILVMASQMQDEECGDGTNAVIMFGGELLGRAEELLRMGLHPSVVVAGYIKAGKKALAELDGMAVGRIEDIRLDETAIARMLRSVVCTKLAGFDEYLAPLLARACIQVLPHDATAFLPQSVRVCKVLGGSISDTRLFHGLVLTSDAEGTIRHVKNAKLVVFSAGVDFAKTEAKATVVLNSGEDLENFSSSEERNIERAVKEISAAGVSVVVSGGPVGELALHYLEKYSIMVVRVPSKFDLRRVCDATGATTLVRLGAPTAEEVGACDEVSVEEVGSTKVCIFRSDHDGDQISTLVVRASTQNVLDDVERGIEDAVNSFRVAMKHPELVAGAGATDIELARRLRDFASTLPGLEQYAVKKFAEALEVFPRTLAENAGVSAPALVASLYAAHQAGDARAGVRVADGAVADAVTLGVTDLQYTKRNALRLAIEAAVDILRVDQLIVARRAGGPVLPKQGPHDAD